MSTPSEAESLASIAASLKALAARAEYDLESLAAKASGDPGERKKVKEDLASILTEGVEAFTAARKAKRNQ